MPMLLQKSADAQPITVTVARAQALSGLGPTKIWQLIASGALQTVSVGRRRLVTYESLQRLLVPNADSRQRASDAPEVRA
jgi:hypothetical protein